LQALLTLAERCWRTRGYGDFWQYMLVAEGVAEIAMDPTVSIWDVAAPMVIVQEAGGRFTDFAGASTAAGGDAIATNRLVHDAARQIMAG
jgi:histidinol-phosphatase